MGLQDTSGFTPVFIIGVPRSGTTLLRVLLDSHSQIAALPESPWLLGAYGPGSSLRALLEDLLDGPYGVVRNVASVEQDHVLAAGRRFLEALFGPVLQQRNKRVLVFKTPHDIRHLDFLTKFMPDARYIHITRDGRDVCMSQLAKKGSFFRDLKEFGRLSFANTFQRWVEWEQRVRSTLYRRDIRIVHVRYEDLVADTGKELRRISDFLGVPFEPAMLDYASARHDYPAWEAGSADVAARRAVSAASLDAWRRVKLTIEMQYTLKKYDAFLVGLGYPPSNLSPSFPDRVLVAAFPLMKRPMNMASRMLSVGKRRVRALLGTVAGTASLAAILVARIPDYL